MQVPSIIFLLGHVAWYAERGHVDLDLLQMLIVHETIQVELADDSLPELVGEARRHEGALVLPVTHDPQVALSPPYVLGARPNVIIVWGHPTASELLMENSSMETLELKQGALSFTAYDAIKVVTF